MSYGYSDRQRASNRIYIKEQSNELKQPCAYKLFESVLFGRTSYDDFAGKFKNFDDKQNTVLVNDERRNNVRDKDINLLGAGLVNGGAFIQELPFYTNYQQFSPFIDFQVNIDSELKGLTYPLTRDADDFTLEKKNKNLFNLKKRYPNKPVEYTNYLDAEHTKMEYEKNREKNIMQYGFQHLYDNPQDTVYYGFKQFNQYGNHRMGIDTRMESKDMYDTYMGRRRPMAV